MRPPPQCISRRQFPIHYVSSVKQSHNSFLFRTQGSVLNLDWATRDLGSLSGNSRAEWNLLSLVKRAKKKKKKKISVQIPMMPSVKGLHYALRIWTRQIFGLVIMMPYSLLAAGTRSHTRLSVPASYPPSAARSFSSWHKLHGKLNPAINTIFFSILPEY